MDNGLAPRNGIVRWIAEIGEDLPEEVRSRLRLNLISSKGPLIAGAVHTASIAGFAYWMTDLPVFLALALCDLALLALRIAVCARAGGPTDRLFLTGLLWAALQGTTIALVVVHGEPALMMLVMASGFGAICGIIGRNFAAPRYAMGQILLIDVSLKGSFAVQFPELVPMLAAQFVLFMLISIGLLRQHRASAIGAIQGELASRRQATTDPLTGLGNRRRLEAHFESIASGGTDSTLLYLDLDGFKSVNDRFGHGAGDRLLQLVAERLTERCGSDALVCRLGGDEFLILLDGVTTIEARSLAAGIIAAVSVPYEIEPGLLARVGVSIGIALGTGGDKSLPAMMAEADRALYAAKTSRKGSCMVHGDADVAPGPDDLSLKSAIA